LLRRCSFRHLIRVRKENAIGLAFLLWVTGVGRPSVADPVKLGLVQSRRDRVAT